MNFLFLLNTFYPNIGGVENATVEICRKLVEKSHKVYVLTTNKSNYHPENKELTSYEEYEGVHIYRVRFTFRVFELPLKALYLAKKYHIDYCYVTDFWGGIALFMKIVFQIPFVYFLNGYNSICPRGILYHSQACRGFEFRKCVQYCHKISIRFLFAVIINKLLIKKAQPVFAVSNAVKNAHRAYIGDVPIEVLHYGIDSQKFHPKQGRSSLKKYGLSENDKVVLFFGRLINERGVMDFIDNWKEGIQQENYKLAIVGLGPEASKLKSKVISLNLQNSVSFLGVLRDISLVNVINRSDIIALPILFPEPLSLVILEAMACAKPVLSFALGGIKEIIDDRKTGLLVPPQDWVQFMKELHRLLRDQELRVSLGIEARQRIEQNFQWSGFLDKLLEKLNSEEV